MNHSLLIINELYTFHNLFKKLKSTILVKYVFSYSCLKYCGSFCPNPDRVALCAMCDLVSSRISSRFYNKVVHNLLSFPKILEPYLLDMWNLTYSCLK
jgi:hypothetical protein